MTIKELTLEFKKFQQETLENFNKMLGLINKDVEEQEDKFPIWSPKNKEKYYFVDNNGIVKGALYEDGNENQELRVLFGNAHKLDVQAERFALINKYTNLYRKYVEEHSEESNWHNFHEEKWYAFYDNKNKRIDTSCDYEGKCQGIIYSDTRQVIRDAIEFIGEKNMLKYVLCVDEDYENYI